jgi:hypothetical protein
MLFGPASSGLVVLGEAAYRMSEFVKQPLVADLSLIEVCNEQTASHDSSLES